MALLSCVQAPSSSSVSELVHLVTALVFKWFTDTAKASKIKLAQMWPTESRGVNVLAVPFFFFLNVCVQNSCLLNKCWCNTLLFGAVIFYPDFLSKFGYQQVWGAVFMPSPLVLVGIFWWRVCVPDGGVNQEAGLCRTSVNISVHTSVLFDMYNTVQKCCLQPPCQASASLVWVYPGVVPLSEPVVLIPLKVFGALLCSSSPCSGEGFCSLNASLTSSQTLPPSQACTS